MSTRASSSSRPKTVRSERNLVTLVQTLRDFPAHEKIAAGVYRLPFKLKLPASLPSTEVYPENKPKALNGFRMQYKLQVSLVGKNKLNQCIPLRIRSAPLPAEPLPCMVQPTSYPISTLKLFKDGEVMLGASVEDSAVGRGHAVDLHLACRNDSKIDIRRVSLQLVETMEWAVEAPGQAWRVALRTLVHLRDVDLPSLSKDRKGRLEVRRLSKDANQRELSYQQIYDDLVSGRNKLQINIPVTARDSYDGQLVKVSHFLHVKLLTRGISSNAAATIPLSLGTPREGAALPPAATRIETPGHPPIVIQGAVPHEIPVVHAIAVSMSDDEDDDDDMQSVIILGGDAILPDYSSLADLTPILPPPEVREVSIPSLLLRMETSVNVYNYLSSLLLEPAWVRLFCDMTAANYASLVETTTPVSNQPRVAALLADYVNGGDALTCAYAAAAVAATAAWYRATTVQKLLPLCVDLPTQHDLLRRELSEWEQTVTHVSFERALSNARRKSR
jgi:hypothetical protein